MPPTVVPVRNQMTPSEELGDASWHSHMGALDTAFKHVAEMLSNLARCLMHWWFSFSQSNHLLVCVYVHIGKLFEKH